MRLLFIDFSLPYVLRDADFPAGGWATELRYWIEGLTALGHSVGVLTWKGARAYAGPGTPCDLLDTYDPSKGARVAKYFYSHIPALLAAARAYKPDILLQSTAGLGTGIMAFLAKRLRRPFVFRVANDVDADERIKLHLKAYEQLAYRYGLRGAALILCQNEYQYLAFRRRFPRKLVNIAHNPFQVLDPAPEIHPRSGRRYVAWLAVFRRFKNLPSLFRLASTLPDIEFHVAGSADSAIDDATAEALDLLRGLRNVRMVGYVRPSQVPVFLSQAVTLLSTSDAEGFSNTFLESFAAGTPVIARSIVDADGIIGRNALGVSAVDEAGLREGIRDLWTIDDAAYEDLARRCRNYVETNHAPAVKAAQLVRIVENLKVGRR